MTTMEDAEAQTLDQRIKQRRQHLGLSTTELARRAGVTRDTLSAWENGTTTPRANRLLTLAGILETNIGWLLEGTSDSAPPASGGSETAALREQLGQARELARNLATILDSLQSRLDALEQDGHE